MKRLFAICTLTVATSTALAGDTPTVSVLETPAVSTDGNTGPKASTNTEVSNDTVATSADFGGNPLLVVPLSSLTQTRERPLFAPTRRPPPVIVAPPPPAPVVVEVKPAETTAPPFTLIGTIVSRSGGLAILMNSTTNTEVRLRVGEGSAGWRLQRIAARSVQFEHDGILASIDFPSADGQPTATISLNLPFDTKARSRKVDH